MACHIYGLSDQWSFRSMVCQIYGLSILKNYLVRMELVCLIYGSLIMGYIYIFFLIFFSIYPYFRRGWEEGGSFLFCVRSTRTRGNRYRVHQITCIDKSIVVLRYWLILPVQGMKNAAIYYQSRLIFVRKL